MKIFFKRKEIFVPTLPGVILLLTLFIMAVIAFGHRIHGYLAPTRPISDAQVLLVEGWLPDSALQEALEELGNGPYKAIVTIGGPLSVGSHLSEYGNYADLSAATLRELGCDDGMIDAVSVDWVKRERTQACAITFKEWLTEKNPRVTRVNLVSEGTHARRSWYLHRKMLSPGVHVGVISIQSLDYDPCHWWSSSAGVRSVLSEVLAFAYTKLFL